MNQKLIGVAYLALGLSFSGMVYIIWAYIPLDNSKIISWLSINETNGVSIKPVVWLIINAIFSLYLGIRLLIAKAGSSISILIAALLLVFLDFLPIFQSVIHFFAIGQLELPWTSLIFVIHLYLLYSVANLKKLALQRN